MFFQLGCGFKRKDEGVPRRGNCELFNALPPFWRRSSFHDGSAEGFPPAPHTNREAEKCLTGEQVFPLCEISGMISIHRSTICLISPNQTNFRESSANHALIIS